MLSSQRCPSKVQYGRLPAKPAPSIASQKPSSYLIQSGSKAANCSLECKHTIETVGAFESRVELLDKLRHHICREALCTCPRTPSGHNYFWCWPRSGGPVRRVAVLYGGAKSFIFPAPGFLKRISIWGIYGGSLAAAATPMSSLARWPPEYSGSTPSASPNTFQLAGREENMLCIMRIGGQITRRSCRRLAAGG